MKPVKFLHAADLHFENNPTTLAEVVTVADFIVAEARAQQPDAIGLAGDTIDEFHARIRLDSDAAREAIRFVTALANIAPVVIVRGTESHDRNAPYIFQHLRTKFPVFVAFEPTVVSLIRDCFGVGHKFVSCEGNVQEGYEAVATFTLVPQLDKRWLEASSIKDGNRDFRELFHDLMSGYGLINEQISAPCILVAHGMVTGATFSSGQQAVGEDLEMPIDALRAAKCDYVALGHVHRMQVFGPDVAYSGSPGRLNFGEPEDKVFLMVDVERGQKPVITAIPTPARRFVFVDAPEFDGLDAELEAVKPQLAGAHVRVRFSLPEERRHEANREGIEDMLLAWGAVAVKVECQIIPATRQRAAGISAATSLPEKVRRWGDATGVEVPDRVMAIASVIEGLTVEELAVRFKDAEKVRDVA